MQYRWLKFLRSPFWICFLVAVVVRGWLIVHTNGVLAGDEAMVGIQAEHILRGEHPLYYYGQPYMGSFQMYVIAGIFLVTGPSVWAMRLEPLLISLVIVTLTWYFSAALADAAQLSARPKMLFMTIASLLAAFPPLYDTVEEMRTTGGYVEAFMIMLWLLFCAFRLTQRWGAGAATRELALRWAGIGLLVGVGFWIDPLVVYALLTIGLWIGGFVLIGLLRSQHQSATHPRMTLLKQVLLGVMTAVPAALVGFAPGLYWGAHHQWANLRYLFQKGGTVPSGRLHTIVQVQRVYTTCLAPRAFGGALPTQPEVTLAQPHLLTVGLVVSVCCLVICVASVLLILVWPHPLLIRMRQMTLLPLLFLACASIIFCTASIAVDAIRSGCSSVDLVGRYVVPLVIVLPFLLATPLILPAIITQLRKQQTIPENEATRHVSTRSVGVACTRLTLLTAMQAGLLVVLTLYFCAQGVAYLQVDAKTTFQITGCAAANPTDQGLIINYMRQAHIRYAWATRWLGDPITFKTNSAILVTELHGRIPANSNTVLHANRPSILLLVLQNDSHLVILRVLDTRNVTYHIERLSAQPGVDVLVVTPLNRTVSPLDPAFALLFRRVFKGCLTE